MEKQSEKKTRIRPNKEIPKIIMRIHELELLALANLPRIKLVIKVSLSSLIKYNYGHPSHFIKSMAHFLINDN